MAECFQLQDVFKSYTYDQDKVSSPEETVAHVRERFAGVDLDILDKTMRIDSGRLDIPVYISLCGTDAVPLTSTKKQMGKGGTVIQAEASALMELAERFSFFPISRIRAFPWPPTRSWTVIPYPWRCCGSRLMTTRLTRSWALLH